MTFELILDVAIGLVLIYALFSLLGSTIVEMITSRSNWRGRILRRALYGVFDDKNVQQLIFNRPRILNRNAPRNIASPMGPDDIATQLIEHPLIRQQFDGNRFPSYLPADVVADALLNLADEEVGVSGVGVDYVDTVAASETKVGALINMLAGEGGVTRDMLRKRLIRYFDNSMGRVSGWYKREVQVWLLIVGFAIAALFYVDTIALTGEIASNANLRERLTTAAEQNIERYQALSATVSTDPTADSARAGELLGDIEASRKRLTDIEQEIAALDLPIGWNRCISDEKNGEEKNAPNSAANGDAFVFQPNGLSYVDDEENGETGDGGDNAACERLTFPVLLSSGLPTVSFALLGWALTAIAISLGAPFWFDLLAKLVSVRKAGVVPKPSEEDGAAGASSTTSGIAPGAATTQPTAPMVQVSPPTALNEFETNELSADDIRDIQLALGIAPSRANGILNEETRTAIKNYQMQKGHDASGALTASLTAELLGVKR